MATLVTLTEYKTYAEVSSNTDDNRLQITIEYVSEFIKTYCSNKLEFGSYVQTLEVFGDLVYPKELPLQAVSQVEYFDGFSRTWLVIDVENYYIDLESGTVQIFINFFSETRFPIRVTFTAGYTEIPSDLKLATMDLVTHYRKREYMAKKISSGSTIDNSTHPDIGLPPHIRRVLELYRVRD